MKKDKQKNRNHFLCNDVELEAIEYLMHKARIPGVERGRKTSVILEGIRLALKEYAPRDVYASIYGGRKKLDPVQQEMFSNNVVYLVSKTGKKLKLGKQRALKNRAIPNNHRVKMLRS